MRSILTALVAALMLFIVVAAAKARPAAPVPADTSVRMADAADAFIASLGSAERNRGTWELDAEQRFDWHFIPRERYGVRLQGMNSAQRVAAHGLLQSVLSSQGYLKATGVMQLEGILGRIENRPAQRNPEDYYFNIFGAPSPDGPWAWRFEGHHISVNVTAAGDARPSVTPAFMGSNPALVGEGPNAGRRLLGAEEDLARELMVLFSDAQLRTVIIETEAPRDVITGNARTVELDGYQGLEASRMNDAQSRALMLLIEEYLNNAAVDIADAEMDRIHAAGLGNLHFAWAGSTMRGEGHYYRIHGPTVLIEFDNVQGGANHVHSVWRDPQNDFGDDLLRRHYAEVDHP
ncbi:MAG TPA: DUF3500 domain-containing protein [Gemmatimonadetes bacterium]|nr:DUF3500 domain-containing protein [Gemmatimonadota bacterium]